MENKYETPEHSDQKQEEKLPDVAVEEKDEISSVHLLLQYVC